eukprot:943549_1
MKTNKNPKIMDDKGIGYDVWHSCGIRIDLRLDCIEIMPFKHGSASDCIPYVLRRSDGNVQSEPQTMHDQSMRGTERTILRYKKVIKGTWFGITEENLNDRKGKGKEKKK